MVTLFRAVAVLLLCGLPATADLYVSTDGDDGNPGTKDAPFATLEGARDAIRVLRREGLPDGGVTVWLRDGVYERSRTFELDERDSGGADARVVYRACDGAVVRILGGLFRMRHGPEAGGGP